MKIYISGKITGLDYSEAYCAFVEAEQVLKKLGHEPVNPMKKVSEQEGKTWAEYMKEAIPILLDCDGIYLLPNWAESKGARLEFTIADDLGMCVFTDDLLVCQSLACSQHSQSRCGKCGSRLSEDDLENANANCYRCRNSISSVSGVGIMTHAKV